MSPGGGSRLKFDKRSGTKGCSRVDWLLGHNMGSDAMHISEGSFRFRSPCVSRGLWHWVHRYPSSELPKALKLYFCMQTEGWVQGRRHHLRWSISLMIERFTDTWSDACSTWGNAAERQTAQHLHPGRHQCDIQSDPICSHHYPKTTAANALALIPCCVIWLLISTDPKNGPEVKCLQTRNLSAYYANQPMVNVQQSLTNNLDGQVRSFKTYWV